MTPAQMPGLLHPEALEEIERLKDAARKRSRYGHRDATMIPVQLQRENTESRYVFVTERGVLPRLQDF
jgi:hypothetical protein